MEHRSGGISAKHTFAVALAVVIGSLFIWIVQLARQGEPVGYIILTGAGMLVTLLVVGIVLRLVLAVSTGQAAPRRSDMKHVYDTQRVLAQQNRALADQLTRLQKEGSLLPPEMTGINLQPGQMMTADGYIIDSEAFDVLEEGQ